VRRKACIGTLARLSRAEYDEIAGFARHYLLAAGHVIPNTEVVRRTARTS
jgi:hypothetical protein